jgi:phosphoglycolate phosphatase
VTGRPTVLFDLDGTLSDSASGILRSLRAAFDEVGAAWPDEVTARSLLGPPFWHSLPPLVGDARLNETIAAYRRHYVDGGAMYDTRAYPGMAELLSVLTERGVRQAVATSKPETSATAVLDHLGFSGYFATVGGDTADGARDSKAAVIEEVLRRLGEPEPSTVVMVGDRSHDVLGAAAHGIRCIGVLWGYGTTTELTAAGAASVCADPVALRAELDRFTLEVCAR